MIPSSRPKALTPRDAFQHAVAALLAVVIHPSGQLNNFWDKIPAAFLIMADAQPWARICRRRSHLTRCNSGLHLFPVGPLAMSTRSPFSKAVSACFQE